MHGVIAKVWPKAWPKACAEGARRRPEACAEGARRRRPEEKMCGAYPIVGYCGSFLNKLLSPKNIAFSPKEPLRPYHVGPNRRTDRPNRYQYWTKRLSRRAPSAPECAIAGPAGAFGAQ